MAFLNYFLQFKVFADKNPSNSPNLTALNWVRDIQGVSVDDQSAQVLTIPANSTVSVIPAASAKKFLYLEASAALDVKINNVATVTVAPVVIGSGTSPGSLLLNAVITQLDVTNNGTDDVTIFVASAE